VRRRYQYRPPPRRHPPVASGDKDFRGVEICARCGSTWDASVHVLPERSDDERDYEARRVGERDV
jgi:hypothetical protein